VFTNSQSRGSCARFARRLMTKIIARTAPRPCQALWCTKRCKGCTPRRSLCKTAARCARRRSTTVPCQGASIFRATRDVAFSGDVARSGSSRRSRTRNESIKRDIGGTPIASLLRRATKRRAYADGTRERRRRENRRGDAAVAASERYVFRLAFARGTANHCH